MRFFVPPVLRFGWSLRPRECPPGTPATGCARSCASTGGCVAFDTVLGEEVQARPRRTSPCVSIECTCPSRFRVNEKRDWRAFAFMEATTVRCPALAHLGAARIQHSAPLVFCRARQSGRVRYQKIGSMADSSRFRGRRRLLRNCWTAGYLPTIGALNSRFRVLWVLSATRNAKDIRVTTVTTFRGRLGGMWDPVTGIEHPGTHK